MVIGILAGLASGALWGLTFVAPVAVRPYSEADLAILRYLAFGGTALALMAMDRRFRPGAMTAARIRLALWLGLSGYVIYYLLVAFAIRFAGPAIPPLVIGALPVLLALYGNWRDRDVSWSRLALPLGLMAVGLAVVNGGTLLRAGTTAARAEVALGFLLAVGALAVWFLYAVQNARAMRAADAPGTLGWTSLQALGAMAGVVPLAIAAPLLGASHLWEVGGEGEGFSRFVFWAVLTGVMGSFTAQLGWTLASKRLPLALSAQLIVSETVFALLYGFIWAGRVPHLHEGVGALLLTVGVALGVRAFASSRAP